MRRPNGSYLKLLGVTCHTYTQRPGGQPGQAARRRRGPSRSGIVPRQFQDMLTAFSPPKSSERARLECFGFLNLPRAKVPLEMTLDIGREGTQITGS